MRNKGLRMCISCHSHKEKHDLIRLIVNVNKLDIDKTYKSNCRGFYICKDADCIIKAIKTKKFSNILKRNITDNELENLFSTIEK